jgi:prepilin-type N-terminal cleavage/methylation domain-containing protein
MDRLPRRLRVRLRARLYSDERGFTMIELIIAMSIITAALVSLAYTATNGFRYIAFARERQAADQISNQVMEEVRGLAYSKIKQGLKTEDLATDPYVESCSGVYRLHLPGTDSCTGDKIVSTSSLGTVAPLVPNNGTIGKAEGYPVDYSYRVYVSNNCPAVGTDCTTATPYRVTVYVAWDSPQMAGVAEKIQSQSYFWSPSGCVSSSTHPFSAPCQPFFYGQALIPAGTIEVSGSFQGGLSAFRSGSLLMTDAESTIQQEQVSQVQGQLSPTAVTLVADDGTCNDQACSGGATSTKTTAADADPSGTTPTYSSTTLPAGPVSAYTTASGSASLTVTNAPGGDSGASESAVTANATYPCPPNPPQASSETDSLPCGGSQMHQAGTLSMSAVLNGFLTDLGGTTIASVAPLGNGAYSWAFADREAVTGQAGNIEDTVDRQIGRVNIGGLPANMPQPNGWDQAFIVLTGYHDHVFAVAGTSAAAPTASITAGTLKYWNGNGYTTIDLTAAGANGYGYSLSSYDVTVTANVNNQPVSVRMRLDTGSTLAMASVPTTVSTPSGSGTIPRNTVTSTVGSPIFGTLRYTISIGGNAVADLSIAVNLGTITAKSSYQAAPTAG